jgi:hypothetical protein
MDLSLFLPPLAACLVIVAIHSYLGLHVIAREVIFVDLSLAQMAALGSAVAILAGGQPDSTASFLYALGFTSLGAALFALTRTEQKGRVPQEAFIGIVYVVASAAAILVADRTHRGLHVRAAAADRIPDPADGADRVGRRGALGSGAGSMERTGVTGLGRPVMSADLLPARQVGRWQQRRPAQQLDVGGHQVRQLLRRGEVDLA